MPILRWFKLENQNLHNSKVFIDQWERLAYTLRDVAYNRRIILSNSQKIFYSSTGMFQADMCDTNFDDDAAVFDAYSKLPLYTEYVFGLCKKIIHATIDAMKYRGIFRNKDGISSNPKVFLKGLDNLELSEGFDGKIIEGWKAVDEWYWILADPSKDSKDREDDTKKGIRDLLEHRNVILQVDCGADGDNWYCDVDIYGTKYQILKRSILEELKKIVRGICHLYDCMWMAISPELHAYDDNFIENGFWILPYGYRLHVTGEFCDYVYFWPEFGEDNWITEKARRIVARGYPYP
jgi:hypothetical protein